MAGGNVFEGRLIRLRAYEPSDAEIVARHRLDSEISRYDAEVGWPIPRAQIAQFIEEMAKYAPEHDNRHLTIETLDGKVVGSVSAFHTNRKHGTFDVGIGLAERSEWGKGYGKEAMLLLLRYMFHELRYQKCNLLVYAFNERALGFYRHIGFQQEGRRRRNVYTNGEYHDDILMGMTRDEFDELYPDMRIILGQSGA